MHKTIKDNDRTLVLKKASHEILNCYGCYFDIHHKKCPQEVGFLMCIADRKQVNWRETIFSKLLRYIKGIINEII